METARLTVGRTGKNNKLKKNNLPGFCVIHLGPLKNRAALHVIEIESVALESEFQPSTQPLQHSKMAEVSGISEGKIKPVQREKSFLWQPSW